MYHKWDMYLIRNIAFRLLPLLVVVWMAFVVLGGALYLAEHGDSSGDSLVKAGVGLCAATAAVLLATGAGKVLVPSPYIKWIPLYLGLRSSKIMVRGASAPLVIPLRPLLQVFRI